MIGPPIYSRCGDEEDKFHRLNPGHPVCHFIEWAIVFHCNLEKIPNINSMSNTKNIYIYSGKCNENKYIATEAQWKL
jgi:hypothetical protein